MHFCGCGKEILEPLVSVPLRDFRRPPLFPHQGMFFPSSPLLHMDLFETVMVVVMLDFINENRAARGYPSCEQLHVCLNQ
jgi:hypothetical protein